MITASTPCPPRLKGQAQSSVFQLWSYSNSVSLNRTMVYFHPNCISRLKHFGRCFPTGSGEADSDDPFCYSLQLPLQKAFSNGNIVCPHSSSHFNYCWITKKILYGSFPTNSEVDPGPHVSYVGKPVLLLCGTPATDCPKPCSCHPPSPLLLTAPGRSRPHLSHSIHTA